MTLLTKGRRLSFGNIEVVDGDAGQLRRVIGRSAEDGPDDLASEPLGPFQLRLARPQRPLWAMSLHAAILLLFASPVSAQPGITNGYLTDPHAYVGSLIDFGQVVPESAMPSELARIRPALNACGIHIQNEVRGDMKARLFLPPSEFDHVVDIWDFGGSKAWVWVDRSGPFQPTRCNFGAPDPVPVPNPGTTLPNSGTPPLVIDSAAIIAAIHQEGQLNREALGEVIHAINDPGWFKKFISHPAVIGTLTGVGAWLTGHLATK